jgi:hypothetical protein
LNLDHYQWSRFTRKVAGLIDQTDSFLNAIKLSALDAMQAPVQFASHYAKAILWVVGRKDLRIPNSYPNYSPAPGMIEEYSL